MVFQQRIAESSGSDKLCLFFWRVRHDVSPFSSLSFEVRCRRAFAIETNVNVVAGASVFCRIPMDFRL